MGRTPGSTRTVSGMTVLLDRIAERAAIDDIIKAIEGGFSRACVLVGDAGMGKTRLLQYAVESASDARTAWISGVEAERDLGYAALHRLLRPFVARVDQLPPPQRLALDAAFGLEVDAPADRFLVGLAALSLLADVASERELVCVVDDAQWIDRESLEALSFVARRLEADRIGLLFGVRDPSLVSGVLDGLPTLTVEGLPAAEALELLSASLEFAVEPETARRIVEATNGCPLALVELATGLTEAQLRGGQPFDDALPIGRQLEDHFLRQVRELDPNAQLFLLVAAAESSGDLALVRRAAFDLGADADAEDAALASGLVALRPDVVFRHPLVRTAVYGGAPKALRSRVHEKLAALIDRTDPERRVRHLAAAAREPDEALAAELELAGGRAAQRGGYAAEASVLLEAATLSPSPEQRARRLLRAASAAFNAGLPQRAEALLEQARGGLTDPFLKAEAMRLDGRLRVPLADPPSAPQRLYAAAKMLLPLDVQLARGAFLEALETCFVAQHFTIGVSPEEIARAALATSNESLPDGAADLVLDGTANLFVSNFPEAMEALRRAMPVLREGSISRDELVRWFNLVLALANELSDDTTYNAWVDLVEQQARVDGALIVLQFAMLGRAAIETRAGRFTAAERAYDEAVDITRIIGGFPEFYELLKADLFAWRGEEQEARAAASTLRDLASGIGSAAAVNLADIAVATLDLGLGRYADALRAVEPVVAHNMPGWTCLALPIAIEGAARSGQPDRAAQYLDQLCVRATASGTDWALGQLARCRALLAGPDAERDHLEAIELLTRTSLVTELARAHLEYGEWLRRENRRVDARVELRIAHELFSSMGADAFASRARAELLATGQRVHGHSIDARQELTVQEAQAARHAIRGATNAEIAAQMFISSNTVDYHLRKVYRKLGISSRRELADALPSHDG